MKRKLNVYICGSKAGVLSENEQLQLSFQYRSAPQPGTQSADSSPEKVPALSVHLPVRAEEYNNAYAFPFFENLIPEGEAFRILTKDHVSGNEVFSFLDRFGGDCAGAVAFFETASSSEYYNNLGDPMHEISSAKVAQIIDKLPEDPLLTSLENPPRLSLAGAQSKFAVCKFNGKYYRSNDEHPTTHIIKIANKRFTNLLENELFCMRLSKIILLNTPVVELKTVEGRPYLEIERFDRYIMNGLVHRVHQEDFCQALGIVSNKKYQTGGGASLKDCFRVIEKFSGNLLIDITRFIEWIIFNYLIGNTDAHAKNISLLHDKRGIRLAPFYDLLSTEVYPEKIVDHGIAMLINGKGKYDSLKLNDFVALFEQLGLNATNMMKGIKNKFANIISTAENLRESCFQESLINDEMPQKDISVYDDIIAIIKKRWGTINNLNNAEKK